MRASVPSLRSSSELDGVVMETRNASERKVERVLSEAPPGAVKLVSSQGTVVRECELLPEFEYTIGRDASSADLVFDDSDVPSSRAAILQ